MILDRMFAHVHSDSLKILNGFLCFLVNSSFIKMSLSDGEVKECKEVFSVFDIRNEGKVDAMEVGTMLNAMKLKPTSKMLEKLTGATAAGEKQITIEEFMPIYKEMSKIKDTGCWQDFMEAFNVYDKEGNGMILSGEIVHLLMSLGDKMKRPQVEEILSKTAKIDEEDYMKYEDFVNKVIEGPFPEEDNPPEE